MREGPSMVFVQLRLHGDWFHRDGREPGEPVRTGRKHDSRAALPCDACIAINRQELAVGEEGLRADRDAPREARTKIPARLDG